MKNLFVFCVMCTLLFQKVDASVLSCNSLKEVGDECQLVEGDLLVLDIDHTLIVPNHPALNYHAIERHRSVLGGLTNDWSILLKTVVMDLIPVRYDSQLIEAGVPDLLTEYRNQGVKVMALTASLPNALDLECRPTEVRKMQLQSHGILMSDVLEGRDRLDLIEHSCALGSYPTYGDGILISNTVKLSDGNQLNPKGALTVSLELN